MNTANTGTDALGSIFSHPQNQGQDLPGEGDGARAVPFPVVPAVTAESGKRGTQFRLGVRPSVILMKALTYPPSANVSW